MKRPWLLPLTLAVLVLAAGCKRESTPQGLTKLETTDTKVGKGNEFTPNAKPIEKGDAVWVMYEGRFKNGYVFDTNIKPDGDPFAFIVGNGEVIKAWDQGLIGMKPGGKRELKVPAHLGYGEAGSGETIPPNTDLYFTVEVLDVLKAEDARGNKLDLKDLKQGQGPALKEGDRFTIDYTLKDLRGRTVDERKNYTNKLGAKNLYPVINVALEGMKAGGTRKARLTPVAGIPPDNKFIKGQPLLHLEITLKRIG